MTMQDIHNIFDTPQPQASPQSGMLLVVEPLLQEAHFHRSVILLIDHNKENGAVGLVLNKRLNVKLHEVMSQATCRREIPLHVGGPVDHTRLLYLHTLGEQIRDSVALENGLFLGGNFDDVLRYIDSEEYNETCIKFFVGYSGWSAGQLEAEIAEKSWAVAPFDNLPAAMLAHDKTYWNECVETLGEAYRTWLLCPSDSILN